METVNRVANGVTDALSRIYPDAVQQIYSLALLRLHVIHASRARRYALTPARRIAFLSLLIGECKYICLLAGIFLALLATIQFQSTVDHVVIKATGLASLACGIITVLFCLLLNAALKIYRADLDLQHENVVTLNDAIPITNAGCQRIVITDLNGGLSALFDDDGKQSNWWNPYILIAQPMIWMSWFVIVFMTFLVLHFLVWTAEHPAVGVTHALTESSTFFTPLNKYFPGLALTVILVIGFLYLFLAFRTMF